MKNKLLHFIATAVALLSFSKINYGQAPNLGTAADFVLFTSVGGVSHTGISQITGNVGSNSGLSTGFGNVNGVMHDNDGASAQCTADLILAYNQLNATIPTFFPAPLLGNGQILTPGVFSIPSPATLNLELVLDGLGDPNAVFIFKIQGAFSTNASSKIKLINGTKACNVFWKVEGLVDMAAGTSMKGTIVANNAAINMSVGDTLEGRALSTAGAITVSGVLAYTPIGCGSPFLTGPAAANLGSAECYVIFTSIGALANTPISSAIGDVGSNGGGSVTGWTPADVTGIFHPIPDGSTAACATDLLVAYNYLNSLLYDIELLYPAQFGNGLVLTPHTYLMDGSATFTDTLYLNALGNPNAVFVIQINGALSTSAYSKVTLLNGAQSKNVFWKVEGAVDINNYSVFRGNIISNNGAINLVNTGIILDGRALSTNGAITTAGLAASMPPGCGIIATPSITAQPNNQIACEGSSVSFSVAATGSGLTYQWRKGIVNLVDGGNISGATTATLTINPVSISDAALNYNVIVSGSSAPSATSTNVSLVVNTSPTITAEPSNQTACSGSSVSFSVAATGTNLSYQWRRGLVNLVNGGNISGANSATLTINPVSITDVAIDYNVIVSGACLPDDISINASLIIGGPSITTEPTDQTACTGSAVSFSVIATGTGITYQWRKGITNLNNGGNISGATSATLTINPVSLTDAATDYNVVVSGTCLPNDNSINAMLTVNVTPTATANSNSPICTGNSILLTTQTIAGVIYNWTGPNAYSSAVQNPTITAATILNAGTYSLSVSTSSCTSTLSTVNVVVDNCTDLGVLKTLNNNDPTIGQTVVFTIVVTNNGPNSATGVVVTDVLQSGYTYVSSTVTAGTYNALTGIWTIGTMINGASETLAVTATVNESGSYINTAAVTGNEVDINLSNNSSSVEPNPLDFFIPEGFSPNGDGINDLFVIRGINRFPNNTFDIFNRWGDKIFEEASYKNTWNGTASKGIRVGGDELPVGTYFYILDLGDGTPVYKGTIYLNR